MGLNFNIGAAVWNIIPTKNQNIITNYKKTSYIRVYNKSIG